MPKTDYKNPPLVGQVVSVSPQADVFSISPDTERELIGAAWQKWLETHLPRQVTDGSQNHGAFDEHSHGWYDGRYAAFMAARLIAVRCWSDVIQFDRNQLDCAILDCLGFVLRRQHTDGALDLWGNWSCNEAGFAVPGLVEAYHHLKSDSGETAQQMREKIKTFVLAASESVLTGEVSTANHRWAAACAPLAAAYSICPDQRYLDRIDDYLADGIDCDSDGCWHIERSAGYSTVANHGLMVMADYLQRPELLEHVIRNLEHTLYHIQPDGSVDASFSHRQDRGLLDKAPSDYRTARRVALITGDGRFTTLALRRFPKDDEVAGELMPLLFELDRSPEVMPEPKPLADHYEQHFKHSQVVRVRRGEIALTLTADRGGHFFDSILDCWGGARRSIDWLCLRHGEMALSSIQIAVAGGYAMQPNTLDVLDSGRWLLQAERSHWQHTQHFRPGWPIVEAGRPVNCGIDVCWFGDALKIRIKAHGEVDHPAAICFWVNNEATVVETNRAMNHLAECKTGQLRGGANLRLHQSFHALEISGLPSAAHQMSMQPEPTIPTAVTRNSTCYSLGLVLPLDLELTILPISTSE